MQASADFDPAGWVTRQRAYFHTGATRPVAFRIERLRTLRRLLKANEPMLAKAMHADFGKSAFEAFITEFLVLLEQIDRAIRDTARWARPKRVRTNLLNWPSRSYVLPEPLGVVLVIGAWNYPIQLALAPVVAAIAAGNTVILKPSELTGATSRALAEILNAAFAPEYLRVVEGGVDETTRLLEPRFDKIFFTGSTSVGKIVHQAAARHLTPVTLELGGKSPAIVTADCDLEVSVRRLVWAKFLNAGQTCIAPDFVLVHRTIEQQFLDRVKQQIADTGYAVERGNYVQIINERSTRRLVDLVDAQKVFTGGRHDVAGRFIEPTVLARVSFGDRIMAEEIFGPVLPVIAYDDLDAVIRELQARPKPLALYLFSNDAAVRARVLREISFGGGCVNDAMMHFSNGALPFGGVGQSGLGSYHGAAGFQAFSHEKSILERAWWPEFRLKYFPYTARKEKLLRWLVGG